MLTCALHVCVALSCVSLEFSCFFQSDLTERWLSTSATSRPEEVSNAHADHQAQMQVLLLRPREKILEAVPQFSVQWIQA